MGVHESTNTASKAAALELSKLHFSSEILRSFLSQPVNFQKDLLSIQKGKKSSQQTPSFYLPPLLPSPLFRVREKASFGSEPRNPKTGESHVLGVNRSAGGTWGILSSTHCFEENPYRQLSSVNQSPWWRWSCQPATSQAELAKPPLSVAWPGLVPPAPLLT